MSKTSKPEKDRVNVKLQKTIANLISNVISSLCQQVVQYEKSIDIFGLLCINIDDDVDISVKLNEKFIKKEVVGSTANMDYSKLIETIQKTDVNKPFERTPDVSIEHTPRHEEMDTDNKENDCPLLIDESEKLSIIQKRRPRKPQHTFRHIILDDLPNSKELDKLKPSSPLTDNELKIDTQFEFKSDINNSSKIHETMAKNEINRSVKSNETDESEDKSGMKCNESVKIMSSPNSLLKMENHSKKIESLHGVAKSIQCYKCTICERQFKRKFCLTRHKRVHQNYKTYLCNICGIGFDLINQLKRHLRNTHACSRENLRRSCRNSQKTEKSLKSPPEQYCPIDCSWQQPKATSQLPLLPSKQMPSSTNSSDAMTPKSICFNQFSFPPGLIVANSGKKPSPSAFSQTFSTQSSASTQFQVRQMFNSIMSATDATLPYNNALYYMQNYSPILPTTSNAIYHHPVSNGNSVKSMPSLSSAPLTTNALTLSNSCSQRMPIYRFHPGLFTSPTLKSIPLPLNNNWSGMVRIPDSNQPEKLKQSVSPNTSTNQQAKVSD